MEDLGAEEVEVRVWEMGNVCRVNVYVMLCVH